mgnify:FL=1
MGPLTTRQVLFRIAAIMSVAELSIMLVLGTVPHEASTNAEAALDAVLLAALATPAIYFWVIRPFVVARDEALVQIGRLALTDPLTHLANRRLISEHLGIAIAASVRHKEYGAVLALDLDEFKAINDSHGHKAGDAVLVGVAERLPSIIRAEDVVGRLGGDEFVILIHRLGTDEPVARDRALLIADNLIALVKQPLELNGKILQVGASIGIRLLGSRTLDVPTALHEADVALYRAKDAGRGRAVVFEETEPTP